VSRASSAVPFALMLAACGGPGADGELPRSGRLGSLRDLVLFERSAAAGGPFFLDRFEVTRGDWREFATAAAGRAVAAPTPVIAEADDVARPMSGVDLRQARAFAGWRCCRLPRYDEWAYARGGYPYPWGKDSPATRANTGEFGLGEVLPVGTFESGRYGSGPYDLIGNVAEWTETVPNWWFRPDRGALSPAATALARLCNAPALAVAVVPGLVFPPGLLVAAAGDAAPREVVGFAFNDSADVEGPLQPPTPWQLERSPADHGGTLGLRLCTTPRELLVALAGLALAPAELRQVERFLARGRHAAVLQAALAELDGAGAAAARRFLAAFAP
jgi:hypothetical protein